MAKKVSKSYHKNINRSNVLKFARWQRKTKVVALFAFAVVVLSGFLLYKTYAISYTRSSTVDGWTLGLQQPNTASCKGSIFKDTTINKNTWSLSCPKTSDGSNVVAYSANSAVPSQYNGKYMRGCASFKGSGVVTVGIHDKVSGGKSYVNYTATQAGYIYKCSNYIKVPNGANVVTSAASNGIHGPTWVTVVLVGLEAL